MFKLAGVASEAGNKNATAISPIGFAGVQKVDAIFELERSINGLSPNERVAIRHKAIIPLIDGFIDWMQSERAKLSRRNNMGSAMPRTCHTEGSNLSIRPIGGTGTSISLDEDGLPALDLPSSLSRHRASSANVAAHVMRHPIRIAPMGQPCEPPTTVSASGTSQSGAGRQP